MDEISPDEIKRVISEFDKENTPLISEDSINGGEKAPSPNKDTKKKKRFFWNRKEKQQTQDQNQQTNFNPDFLSSPEFRQFENENKSVIHSWYEKVCHFSGSMIKINPGKEKQAEYKLALATCHLNTTPEDTFAFAIIGPTLFMISGLIFSATIMNADLFFITFFLLAGIGIMIPLTKLPFIFANIWRLKSSKEIVLCIFYIVTYMRQNSNLEKAIEFAADHLSGPLAIELKKVLWDVETQHYSTIQESLDNYLEIWRKTNSEFLESMNLIESSLFEPREEDRIGLLDKSLDIILSETYEKMLHYSHDIQSPLSTLHMLGVILPILGLVILPLVVSFMENVAWYHISILYNVVIPVSVFFIGKNILSTRPGGYSSGDISKDNPLVKAQKEKKIFGIKVTPLFMALIIALPLFLLGISPLVAGMILEDGQDIYLFRDEYGTRWYHNMKVLDYHKVTGVVDDTGANTYIGPYGMVATLLGICLILSFGLGIGYYYLYKTENLILIREQTKKLENEFGSAIFQLGNRLGDGIPLEMAFSKVIDVMGDSDPGKFFTIIDQNIRRLGMSPEEAIFDKKIGAIQFYPSNLILSTMKVLTESIKKGPLIAARAVTNVARYVKEMHAVEERLKDLLAEVISSMNSLIKFLAPVISGIVVGITAMITNIIGTLSSALNQFSEGGVAESGALSGLTSMFGDGIPTYHFQIVVGLYIVQVVYIISKAISGISDGDDKLSEENVIAKNLIKSTILYAVMTAIVMIIFNVIAMSILQKAITAEVPI